MSNRIGPKLLRLVSEILVHFEITSATSWLADLSSSPANCHSKHWLNQYLVVRTGKQQTGASSIGALADPLPTVASRAELSNT